MRHIFNVVSGSYLRTIGRIFAYISIGLAIAYFSGFINIASVNAESVIYTNNLKVPTWAYFTNCSTTDNCWVDFGSTYNVGGVVPWWTTTNSIKTTGQGAGIGLTIYLEEGFITGNYYTVNVLVDVSTDAIPISKTSNTKVVGVGSNELQAYQHASSSISNNSMTHVTGRFTYDMEYLDLTTTASYLSYTFKAVTTGNFLFMTLTTETTTTGRWDVYGYEYINHGAKAPSTEEIQQALQTNFDSINNNISNSQNSINNNINNSTNSINSNIDEMTDKVDNSLNSESDDTTSKNCGVICKLKGIFTGIIELPSKLVNLLVDALKSLFVPTDNQLYGIVNDSKDLAENFGFVGETINFFIEIFTSLLGLINGNGCLELPELTIGKTSLFNEFTFWNAQQVCLADNEILSNNIETIRTITSIVLVGLFIGFASRQFFNILNKNDNWQASTDAANLRG